MFSRLFYNYSSFGRIRIGLERIIVEGIIVEKLWKPFVNAAGANRREVEEAG
jgi:hypothetical protein